MINKNNYTTSINTVTLSDEFINSTKLCELIKQGLNVDHLITFVVKEFITTFAEDFDSKEIDQCVKIIKSRSHCMKYMYLILNFFSFFYQDLDSEYLTMKLNQVIEMCQHTTTELLICLWCFFSLKDYLSIDDRIICIPKYTDKRGMNISHKNYKDMLDDFYKNVRCSINDDDYSRILILPIKLDIRCVPDEINNKIKEYKTKMKFISDLWHYKEFSYFIEKINNPREGKFTYLRFL